MHKATTNWLSFAFGLTWNISMTVLSSPYSFVRSRHQSISGGDHRHRQVESGTKGCPSEDSLQSYIQWKLALKEYVKARQSYDSSVPCVSSPKSKRRQVVVERVQRSSDVSYEERLCWLHKPRENGKWWTSTIQLLDFKPTVSQIYFMHKWNTNSNLMYLYLYVGLYVWLQNI